MVEILKLTSNYCIIYKPSGIPTQSDPTGDKDAMTLTSELLSSMGEKTSLWLIHRLDRVVGGVIVFARNKHSAAVLSESVKEKAFDKEYLAVVEGECEGGIFKDYIFKDRLKNKAYITDRPRQGVKNAELECSVLDSYKDESGVKTLVRVRLYTGRFHQIRAQLSYRKNPIVGDKKYGSRASGGEGIALFASRLGFDYEGRHIEEVRLPIVEKYPWCLFDKSIYEKYENEEQNDA